MPTVELASESAETPFKSINEMLTDSLRKAILSGELEEGEFLRQQNVARRYGVSEVVVREALRRLEAEGLVETERRKGARVSRLSPAEISELYELRILLEELITRHAVPRRIPEDLTQAEDIIKAMDQEKDPVRWLALNCAFHNTLYRPSNRTRLLKFANDLRMVVERYLRLSLGILRGFEVAQKEHREILAAYRKGDPDLAAKRVGAHLRRTAAGITTFLASRDNAQENTR